MQITKQGYEKLKANLNNLIDVERPKIIKSITEARDFGDLSENAEYHAAKERQRITDAAVSKLSNLIATATVVDISILSGDIVAFGATVTIEDQNTEKKKTYKLVCEYESDLDNGLISVESLVGRSLIGKKVGDEVEIKTPAGTKDYEVLKVDFLG